MGTKEASLLWGYPQNTISRWCQQGKIPGAQQTAPCSPWLIPKDAVCPIAKPHK
ncbi:MAG: helix-turn-helix domain-containing protein [Candidatus Faecousia sp.]|nr:helix-turn-helix domain-containing protein [Oscillospiraceae bacterium]MDD6855857.1 helix-turn-helix domain-containing protein [Oscillospiraceae bacterium]MDY2558036.1 helix-turn-helix domain-containing protein [Candidatus Faecousia sp.]